MLFVRQFRYPYAQVVLECPAGKLEPGEDPFEAMKREQKEETGTTSDAYLELAGSTRRPATVTRCCIFTHVVWRRGRAASGPDEFLKVERIPLQKALEMAMNGEIHDAKTQILVLRAARLVEEGKL